LGGIRLGPPTGLGERFQQLHLYLKRLKERGILLAVVSKNNPDEARSVFEQHNGSLLKLDDFVAFHANWEPKSHSLRAVAEELNLGLDSFVFLDDNPMERAAVRAAFPDVTVPEITSEPSRTIEVLERGLFFQAIQVTGEDRQRTESYYAMARNESLRRSAASVEEYLQELGMEIEWGPADEVTLDRVTQLINKTNQFNLTTRRYTLEQTGRLMRSRDRWFCWFRLRDRFADHGLIAVLLAERGAVEWRVDSWLMSCRVLGRGVERFMFQKLAEAARDESATALRAWFIPTAKNAVVKDLLPGLGFVQAEDSSFVHLIQEEDFVALPQFAKQSVTAAT